MKTIGIKRSNVKNVQLFRQTNRFYLFLSQVANLDFLDKTVLRNASTHAIDVMMLMVCVTMVANQAGQDISALKVLLKIIHDIGQITKAGGNCNRNGNKKKTHNKYNAAMTIDKTTLSYSICYILQHILLYPLLLYIQCMIYFRQMYTALTMMLIEIIIFFVKKEILNLINKKRCFFAFV